MYPCVLTCFFSEDDKIVYQDSFMITERSEKSDDFVRIHESYDSIKINKMSERIKYLFGILEKYGKIGQIANPKKVFQAL